MREIRQTSQERSYLYQPGPIEAPSAGQITSDAPPLSMSKWEGTMAALIGLYDPEAESTVSGRLHAAATRARRTVAERHATADAPTEVQQAEATAALRDRQGQVLAEGTILKADQFPGIGSSDPSGIPGAPNFREAGHEGVYGVAQPTVEGVRNVLDRVGAGPGGTGRRAVWTTLREENVVYVNGKSYNLRAADDPYKNWSEKGRSNEDIEKAEGRLKQDILDEAARNGGMITLHEEIPDPDHPGKFKTVPRQVKLESVQTPREVFDDLRAQGYNVDYQRVGITDEMKPENNDLDALTARVANAGPDDAIIMNCHMGKGRTTTAMVAASMVRHSEQESHDGPTEAVQRRPAVKMDIREQVPDGSDAAYRRGEYRAILSLIKALKEGPQSKKDADDFIDKCSALTNLRESILEQKKKGTPEAEGKARDYLDRYFTLITYDQYTHDQAPGGFPQSYSEWRQDRPELDSMLEDLKVAMGLLPGERTTQFA